MHKTVIQNDQTNTREKCDRGYPIDCAERTVILKAILLVHMMEYFAALEIIHIVVYDNICDAVLQAEHKYKRTSVNESGK